MKKIQSIFALGLMCTMLFTVLQVNANPATNVASNSKEKVTAVIDDTSSGVLNALPGNFAADVNAILPDQPQNSLNVSLGKMDKVNVQLNNISPQAGLQNNSDALLGKTAEKVSDTSPDINGNYVTTDLNIAAKEKAVNRSDNQSFKSDVANVKKEDVNISSRNLAVINTSDSTEKLTAKDDGSGTVINLNQTNIIVEEKDSGRASVNFNKNSAGTSLQDQNQRE